MPKTLRQTVAENVKTLMDRADQMSVADLAKKSGLSRQVIYSLLDQSTNAKIDTLEAIANVFGLQPAMLLYVHPLGVPFAEAMAQWEETRTLPVVKQANKSHEGEKGEKPSASFVMHTWDNKPIEEADAFYAIGGSGVEATALRAIFYYFMDADEEGRLCILRHACTESGEIPSLEGVKMPRGWRDLARALPAEFQSLEEEVKRTLNEPTPTKSPDYVGTAVQVKHAKKPGKGNTAKVSARKQPKKVGSRKKVAAKKRA